MSGTRAYHPGMARRALVLLVVLSACRGREPARADRAPEPGPDQPVAASPRIADQPPAAPADDIHGELTVESGQRVLRVWGTPQQMGFAHGALLREEILEVVDDYALGVIPPATIDAAGAVYTATAHIPERLRQEAEGVVEGMRSRGSIHVDGLDRDLEARDLLVLNAMTDLVAIGCSSVSAWGASTADDASLAGAPVVVRNLDWSADAPLLRNQLLVVYQPDDPTRQPVTSVAFAGYLGCLSCMNEAGVTTLFNMGYGDGAASLAGAMTGFAPANLMLRDALERRDVDGDGASTPDDVEAAVRDATHAGSWILHVLGPDGDVPARILEVESDGVVRRDPEETLGPTVLAATNHLRAKARPEPGSRWRRIERHNATADRTYSPDTLWDLGRSLRLSEVVHTLLVEPKSRRMRLWLRTPAEGSDAATKPAAHDLRALMARAH